MANRITTLFDLDSKGFDSGLKKLRSGVANADGFVNKLKAAGSGLGATLQDNLGAAALSAGTALVGFGIKAVTAFQHVALAAGKFSDATGLAVEDASRWIEVAGDIGVSSDEVESALGKMNKTLGNSPALFTKLGVEVAKTKDGNTDVNGTFLNVIDRLNGITDPAEKARVATQLLGKGWQGMAELIAQGSGKLKASLAGVQDGKVINAAELEKARDLRAKLDDLSDSIENVTLKIGGDLAPAVANVVGAISDATGVMADLNDKTKELTGIPLTDWVTGGAKSISDLAAAAKDDSWTGSIYKGTRGFLEMIPIVGSLAKKIMPDYVVQTRGTADATEHAKEITEAQAGMLGELRQETADATQTEKEHAAALKASAEESAAKNQAAKDLLDTERSLYGDARDQIQKEQDYADSLRNASEQIKDYTKATGDHKEKTDAQRQSTRDATDAVIAASEAYVASKGAALDSKLGVDMQIQSLQSFEKTLKPGSPLLASIQAYVEQLQAIPTQVDTQLSLNIKGVTTTVGGDLIGNIKGKRAAGGPVSAGSTYLVGEQGPELLTLGSTSGVITPNDAISNSLAPSGAGPTYNISVNAGMGADGAAIGQQVIQAIKAYELRNGPGWRR